LEDGGESSKSDLQTTRFPGGGVTVLREPRANGVSVFVAVKVWLYDGLAKDLKIDFRMLIFSPNAG
jgi:hypothetical protein